MKEQSIAEKTLQIKNIKTEQEYVDIEATEKSFQQELEQHFPQGASIMLWAMQAVTAGTWDGRELVLANKEVLLQDVLEIRIFTEKAELHLTTIDGRLKGRYIQDLPGNETQAVDSISRLWGEKAAKQEKPGFIILQDTARKLELTVPYTDTTLEAKYFTLTTRNYIGYEKNTGLAGYVDYRFVAIDELKEG